MLFVSISHFVGTAGVPISTTTFSLAPGGGEVLSTCHRREHSRFLRPRTKQFEQTLETGSPCPITVEGRWD
jgi:hypothetical protein